ncbi:MAG: hypothetical protein ACK5LY_04865 [Lachnospirales bacterium]
MDLIFKVNEIFEKKPKIVKVSNFYFEKHLCEVAKEEIKINLSQSILDTNTKELSIFGYCEHCNTLFYNKDFK